MDFYEKYQLNDFTCMVFAGEKFSEERNITQNRNAFFLQSVTIGVKSAEHDNLTVLHAQMTFDTAD